MYEVTWRLMRYRVVNTIRSWLDTHYIEVQDAPILERVEKFAEDLQNEGAQTMSKQLQGLVARKASSDSLLSDSARSWMSTELTPFVEISRIGRPSTYHIRRSSLTPCPTLAQSPKRAEYTSAGHFTRRTSSSAHDHRITAFSTYQGYRMSQQGMGPRRRTESCA